MSPREGSNWLPDGEGMLVQACMCGREMARVPAAAVRAGTSRVPCGRCDPTRPPRTHQRKATP